MVQFPYLQPFDDVEPDLYTSATLGVYELERVELLRDLFMWTCRRSAARYAAIRMSLGEPDPFRLVHRTAMRDLVGAVIRQGMDKKAAATHIGAWSAGNIEFADAERFREIVERELLSLHEGNFARYRVTPSEFTAWMAGWGR